MELLDGHNFTFNNNDINSSFDDSYNLSLETSDSCSLQVHSAVTSPYFQCTVYIMYCIIFTVALSGNGLVCFTVQSTPRMRTVTNYFIVNLAVGDILMTIFCVPFTFVPLLLQYWPFGLAMCRVVNYTQAVSVFVSAYTLVAISFDRYMAILWPLKPRLSKRYAGIIIVIVWVFALMTALPIPLTSTLVQPLPTYKSCNRYVCMERWPSEQQYLYYSMALMGLQFIVPLFALVYTYTRIALVVWCKRIPGEAENSRDQRIARSKRKMVKMMITVVIVFVICWLPFNVFLLVLNEIGEWSMLPYLFFLVHWLAMSHTCYNPIIYCYMNARFRLGFVHTLGSVPCFLRCLPETANRPRSSMAGFPLTGVDTGDNSTLHRVNTSTTYISMRNKSSSAMLGCQCNHVALSTHQSSIMRPRSTPATGIRSARTKTISYNEDQI